MSSAPACIKMMIRFWYDQQRFAKNIDCNINICGLKNFHIKFQFDELNLFGKYGVKIEVSENKLRANKTSHENIKQFNLMWKSLESPFFSTKFL